MAGEGAQQIQEFRDNRYTEDQISQWQGQTAADFRQGGYSEDQINDYFGTKQPDDTALKAHVQKNMKENGPPPVDPTKPMEAKDVWDYVKAGLQGGSTGLATHGLPDVVPGPSPSALQNFAYQAGHMVSDFPVMAAAGAAAAETGPIGAAAAAWGAPGAVNRLLIDHLKNKNMTTSQFANSLVGAAVDAGKGALTGAAFAATGGNVAALNEIATVAGKPFLAAITGTGGKLASEVIAQATVASVLDGHLPHEEDFTNAAIAGFGLHAVGYGAGKLVDAGGASSVKNKVMNIFANTGIKPAEVIAAANEDPQLKGELASEDPAIPKAAKEPAPTEPAKEPEVEKPEVQPPNAKAAQDEILSRIHEEPEEEEKSIAGRLKDQIKTGVDNTRDIISDAYHNGLDYTDIIKQVQDEIGDQPIDRDNAHVLMRLHAAVEDKIRGQFEDGTRNFWTQKINGEAILQPIEDYKTATGDASLDGLRAYGIAARSLELFEERHIEQGGSRENDQAFVDANQHIKPYFDRLVKAQNRVLDYLAASGRYSHADILSMKDLNERFIPLTKVLEPDPITGASPSGSRDIKRIGSSDLKLQDPILSLIKNSGNMIKMAHETEAANAFVKSLGKAEDPTTLFRKSEEQAGIKGKSQIATYEDGKRTLWDVDGKTAEAINAMAGNRQAMSVWTSLLRPFASLLRMGTVENPLFGLRHAWRQELTASTLSQTGLKPFQGLAYTLEYLAGGDKVKDFINDGGAVSSIVPLAKGYLDGKMQELNGPAPILGQVWNGVKTVRQFSHAMIIAHDNIVRYAEYSRMLDQGASRTESAFAAREVLPDFQKSGLQKSALQSITAFLKVHMQGMDRMRQETVENPMGYLAKNLAYITVPSVLMYMAQKDDDAIKDLPNWQKFNYWTAHIPNWRPANSLAEAMSVKSAYPSNTRQLPDGSWQVNDGPIIRIQKPFTNGILFGSAIEAMAEAMEKKNAGVFGDFLKTVVGSTLAEPIPNAIEPVIEHMTNRNFYTGQAIVRQSMENKLPETQYDRYTSETAKAIGTIVSYVPLIRDIGPHDAKITSPKIIDNYMHAWTGTLGQYAISTADFALRKLGIAPDVVKPVGTLADIPFVKEFMIRFPNGHPQSVQDFQDRFAQAEAVHNSVQQLYKQGDVAGAVALKDRYAGNMERLTYLNKGIQNINGAIQKVYQNTAIDPVQKRQLIDSMMYQIVLAAKQGNSMMDKFEEAANNRLKGK